MMPYQVWDVFLVYQVKVSLHMLLDTLQTLDRLISLLQASLVGVSAVKSRSMLKFQVRLAHA